MPPGTKRAIFFVSANPSPDQTRVRPYHEGDERELVPLFQRVFGTTITEQHWRWKLHASGAPVDNVWLAFDGERPVFQYAGIPQRWSIEGRERIGVVSVDTMTDPDYRRRGLLTRVAAQAYACWREQNVAFVIGLPNQQWGSRTTALGWQELFGLQWLARPLLPQNYAARRLKLPWLRQATWLGRGWDLWLRPRLEADAGIRVEPTEEAGAEFDRLWEARRARAAFSTVRDAAWVRWRFLASTQRRYELTVSRRGDALRGYAACHVLSSPEKTSGFMAELACDDADPAARDALLRDLIVKLHARGAESLITLAIPGTRHFRWLRRQGFFRGPGFSVQLVPLATDLPLEHMRDTARWDMSGADFDVI
jgi:hypothetical protein